MRKVILYTKAECHLCEIAKERVNNVRKKVPFEFEEIDITQDPRLFQRYQHKIPVVEMDGVEVFVYRVSEKLLVKRLRGG